MLLSEKLERSRRFKLAIRAGVPVLILISLVFSSIFLQNGNVELTMKDGIMMGAILFITVYFIYFLIDLSAKETLIDQTSQGFNERAFIGQIEAYKPKTIAMLYIENLSTINENYNINDVDLLLYNLTHMLNNNLEQGGFKHSLIARRYGAEFLIAINKNSPEIKNIFNTFIEKNKILNGIEINYSFSIITNTSDKIEEDITHLKDIIISQEQEPSRKEEINSIKDAKEISETEKEIVNSINMKNLALFFKPLQNSKTDKFDIYEVSIKLKSPKVGNILPRVYLPVVNRLGLGREYDLSIVKHILNTLPLIDKSISLQFNISPFSLRDSQFQKDFFICLDESGINPSRIIIELYERKAHHDLGGYLETLNRFREKGIRIAIDNFGSSNSSLEYMKNFNFDLVQFDRDFVTKLDDANTKAILNSMIKMSKDLNIITIAKWVDNNSQKAQLKELGIDYMQGHGIEESISEQALVDRYNQIKDMK